MRPRTPYGTVSSLFWDSDTGWQLQRAGWEPLILLLYLTSNRHANILGLYRLPWDQIGRELKVIPTDALPPAFRVLERLDVAFYDRETEFVWIRAMAGQRLHPTDPQQTLAAKDGARWLMVQRSYIELPANPFLGEFFDEYHLRLRLMNRRPGSGCYERGEGLPDRLGDGPPHRLGDRPRRALEQVDQIEDRAKEHRTRDHLNRRVEIADAVENLGQTSAPETSAHDFHTPSPAPQRRPADVAREAQDREPLLPLGRLQLVPDPVNDTAADLEKAIADLVLNQLRRLQRWQSRADLTDAALILCSKTPGLERARRPHVEAGIDRALQEAHEQGREFTCAPGVQLMDTKHDKRDAG